MTYERKFAQKPFTYFMFGKILFFKETAESDEIYAVKCSLKKSPMLFRLLLPLSGHFGTKAAD